jgi:hypothetical protein
LNEDRRQAISCVVTRLGYRPAVSFDETLCALAELWINDSREREAISLAKGYSNKKLEVYGLQVHDAGKAIGDYKTLFGVLEKTPPGNRIHKTSDRLLALQEVEVKGTQVRMRAYEGPPGMYPLILNTTKAKTRVQKLGAGEVMATGTHALLDLNTRRAVIEFNQRGAKAHEIALVIQEVAQKWGNYESLVVELAPIVTGSFLDEINKFGRIQLANLSVIKPNIDWDDHYSNITAVAEDSGGNRISVEIAAERNDSLEKNKGIISFIKQLVSAQAPVIKNAKVVGTMQGASHSTFVSLNKHIQSRRIDVKLGIGGHVDDEDIDEKMRRYLAEVVKEVPAHGEAAHS